MTYKDTILTYSPLAYWPLDDASGDFADAANGHTMTVTGSPTYSQTDLTGYGGTCVDFTGSAYGSAVHAAWNDITGPWSVIAWINSDAWDFGSGKPFLEKYNGTSAGYGFRAAGSSPGNKMVGFRMNSGYADVAGTTGLSTGATYFVAHTYGTQGRVFVNGVLNGGPSTYSAPASVSSRSLRLGAQGDSQSSIWDGRLQHVAMWDRELTPTEVSDLYSNIPVVPPTPPGTPSTSTNKPPLGFIPIA